MVRDGAASGENGRTHRGERTGVVEGGTAQTASGRAIRAGARAMLGALARAMIEGRQLAAQGGEAACIPASANPASAAGIAAAMSGRGTGATEESVQEALAGTRPGSPQAKPFA